MTFVKEVNKALDIMQNPGKGTTKQMKTTGDSLAFYYRLTIIPLVLFIVLGAIFTTLFGNTFGQAIGFALGRLTNTLPASTIPYMPTGSGLASSLYASFGVYSVIAYSILMLWVILPILLIIFSVFYQGVGAFFGTASKKLDATVSAAVYGIAPIVLFFWITTIPFIGNAIFTIILLWSLIVLIAALANAHRTTRLRAFATIVLTEVFLFVAISIVVGVIVSLAVLTII